MATQGRLRAVTCALAAAVALTAAVTLAASPAARATVQTPLQGADLLAAFGTLPLLPLDVDARYISSYDRTGGNDDGFDGTYSALYVDERGEHVIFDEKGPGTLFTLWFTSRENGFAPLGWGRVRFYFDDEASPRLDVDGDALFGGKTPPFAPPFAYGPTQSTGGYVSYVPLPFARRLRITTERRAGFYNAFFHRYAPDRPVVSWTGQESLEPLRKAWSQPGVDPKVPAAEQWSRGVLEVPTPLMPDGDMTPASTTVFETRGTGAVTAVRVNPLFPLTPYELNHVILRAYWDGETEPSIDAPLGSFFGSGLGEADVRAVPLGMSPSGWYYCYLPMPFWRSARFELVNENPRPLPRLAWEIAVASPAAPPYAPGEAGYFKARYRREWPTTPGRDYTLLDARGRGVYVGQVMTVEPIRPEVKRWWEGDLQVVIDGRRHPSLQGTGHEDEYLGGWSNEWFMNPYSLPLHGEPKTAQLTQVDFQWSAATTVYRFFPGGMPFQSSIRVSTEHGVANQIPAMYSSVAYSYERPEVAERVDVVEVGDLADERRHEYVAGPLGEPVRLTSRFEGRPAVDELTDTGRAIGERSSFVVNLPAEHRRVRLRRLYDQAAVQDAEVWIDGRLAGPWYTAATDGVRRWAEDEFLVPAALSTGKRQLRVEIRVRRPTWTEFRYEAWVIRGRESSP